MQTLTSKPSSAASSAVSFFLSSYSSATLPRGTTLNARGPYLVVSELVTPNSQLALFAPHC